MAARVQSADAPPHRTPSFVCEVPLRVTRPQERILLARLEAARQVRSEEHTSELQSHSDLVCRLLLEKKKAHSARSESGATKPTTYPSWTTGTPRQTSSPLLSI